jgi:hypothetical protein
MPSPQSGSGASVGAPAGPPRRECFGHCEG